MQEITITIAPDGTVTVGVTGVSGPACEQLTRELEQALMRVDRRVRTADYARRQDPRKITR